MILAASGENEFYPTVSAVHSEAGIPALLRNCYSVSFQNSIIITTAHTVSCWVVNAAYINQNTSSQHPGALIQMIESFPVSKWASSKVTMATIRTQVLLLKFIYHRIGNISKNVLRTLSLQGVANTLAAGREALSTKNYRFLLTFPAHT